MMVVYEVFLHPTADASKLLSEDTLKETQAQIMTVEEATAVGFSGIKPDPKGREMRLIAVAKRDAQWIARALDSHPDVASFRANEI